MGERGVRVYGKRGTETSGKSDENHNIKVGEYVGKQAKNAV